MLVKDPSVEVCAQDLCLLLVVPCYSMQLIASLELSRIAICSCNQSIVWIRCHRSRGSGEIFNSDFSHCVCENVDSPCSRRARWPQGAARNDQTYLVYILFVLDASAGCHSNSVISLTFQGRQVRRALACAPPILVAIHSINDSFLNNHLLRINSVVQTVKMVSYLSSGYPLLCKRLWAATFAIGKVRTDAQKWVKRAMRCRGSCGRTLEQSMRRFSISQITPGRFAAIKICGK